LERHLGLLNFLQKQNFVTHNFYLSRWAEISGIRKVFVGGDQKKTIEKKKKIPSKVNKFCNKKIQNFFRNQGFLRKLSVYG
jgi:hypothetical protein